MPHPRRDQHGAARPHRHPLAVQLHRRPDGALQDVVDLGMLPVVVGAGVRLDLDPVEAGRGVGHVRERPPGPAAGAAHRVERAGGAARFAWDEFFYAEHHNPHTQKAYMAAVKRFLAWAEGQGVELPAITPGMVGQYLVGLGGSAAKRNLHLSALRGFFDRLVNRHVVILNPAASVRGVKDQVIEGKTPEITIEQARTLLASIQVAKAVDDGQGGTVETPLLVGLRDRAILATLAYTACRAGAVAKLRLGDFQHDGTQYVLRFQEKGGKSREIPVRHDLEGYIRAYLDAAGIAAEAKDRPLFRSTLRRTEATDRQRADQQGDLRAGQAAAEGCRAAGAAVAAFLPGDGDHRPA